MNIQEINAQLELIAKTQLDIETLEHQGSDRLDFHDLAVWNIKQALLDAYLAGKKEAEKNQK